VVRLRDNEDIEGGLIARITVPADLVTPAEVPAPTMPYTSVFDRDAARASGIAGAFTGTMPRLRGNGTPAAAPVVHNRRRTDPGYQGDPADPVALFGDPLPEAAPETKTGKYEHALTGETPTQRLPIFEAVLSQWFADGADPADPAGDTLDPLPGNDVAVTSWASPADEGWSAAQALLERTTEDPVTKAGLPLRVRGARLVPGSAAPRPRAEDAPPPLPPRSANAVRNRMSSYQQGVRRGRHYLVDTYGADDAPDTEEHP
jgi:hypothetical protein